MEGKIDLLVNNMGDVMSNVKELTKNVTEMKEELKTMDDEMKTMHEEIKNLNIQDEFQQIATKFKEQEVKNKIFDQEKRRKNIVIHGLEEIQGERFDTLKGKVLGLFNNQLELDIKIWELDDIFRLGKPNQEKKRPVLVKFVSQIRKKETLMNRRMLKNTKIFINDDFSKETEEKRKNLIPVMLKLRENNAHAVLRGEKLYVDGKLWTGELVEMNTDGNPQGGNVINDDSNNSTPYRKRGPPTPDADKEPVIRTTLDRSKRPKDTRFLQKSDQVSGIIGKGSQPKIKSFLVKKNDDEHRKNKEGKNEEDRRVTFDREKVGESNTTSEQETMQHNQGKEKNGTSSHTIAEL